MQQTREQKNTQSIKHAIHQIYPRHNANNFRIFVNHIVENIQDEWPFIFLYIIDNVIETKYLHAEVMKIAEKLYEKNNKQNINEESNLNENTDKHKSAYEDKNRINSNDFYKPYSSFSLPFSFTGTKHFMYNFFILQVIKKVYPKHDPLLSNSLFILLVNLSTYFYDTLYEYDSLLLANSLVSKSTDKKTVLMFYHKFSRIFLKNHKFTNFLICLQKMCLIDKKIKFDANFIRRIARICIYKEDENLMQGDWKYSLDLILACKQRENKMKYDFEFKMYDLVEKRFTDEFVEKIKEKRNTRMPENYIINEIINEIVEKHKVNRGDLCVANNTDNKKIKHDIEFIAFLKINNFKYCCANEKIYVCGFEEKSRIVSLYELKENMKKRQKKNIEKEKRKEEEDVKRKEREAKSERIVEENKKKIAEENKKKISKKVHNVVVNDYFRKKYNLFRIVMMKIKEYVVNKECKTDDIMSLCGFDKYYNEREEIRKKVIKQKNEIEENKKNIIKMNIDNIKNIKEELENKIESNENNKSVEQVQVTETMTNNEENYSFRRGIKKPVKEELESKIESNASDYKQVTETMTNNEENYSFRRGIKKPIKEEVENKIESNERNYKQVTETMTNNEENYSFRRGIKKPVKDEQYSTIYTNKHKSSTTKDVNEHTIQDSVSSYNTNTYNKDYDITEQNINQRMYVRGIKKVEIQHEYKNKVEKYAYDYKNEENKKCDFTRAVKLKEMQMLNESEKSGNYNMNEEKSNKTYYKESGTKYMPHKNDGKDTHVVKPNKKR